MFTKYFCLYIRDELIPLSLLRFRDLTDPILRMEILNGHEVVVTSLEHLFSLFLKIHAKNGCAINLYLQFPHYIILFTFKNRIWIVLVVRLEPSR